MSISEVGACFRHCNRLVKSWPFLTTIRDEDFALLADTNILKLILFRLQLDSFAFYFTFIRQISYFLFRVFISYLHLYYIKRSFVGYAGRILFNTTNLFALVFYSMRIHQRQDTLIGYWVIHQHIVYLKHSPKNCEIVLNGVSPLTASSHRYSERDIKQLSMIVEQQYTRSNI